MPGNAVEDHSLSPAGQYSPAPVIVQTTYNYRYDYYARIDILCLCTPRLARVSCETSRVYAVYVCRIYTVFLHGSFLSNSGTFMGPDAGVGVNKRAHEESDSSPDSPAPLAIVESPEPPEQQQPQQPKRQRIHEMDDH